MHGHVYILKNSFMPGLVKIGFTDRDPYTRANELSSFTGVPGKFEIVSSWLVSNAALIEKQLHAELDSMRRTGEFFEIAPDIAHAKVKSLLIEWDEVDENGQSYEQKKLFEREKEKRAKQALINQKRRTQKNLVDAIQRFSEIMRWPFSNAFRIARDAAEPKGWFASFKSPNEQLRKQVFDRELAARTKSLRQHMNMPWLLTIPPESNLIVTRDVCFATGPNGAGPISFDEFNNYWEERNEFKQKQAVRLWDYEKQREEMKKGKVIPDDERIWSVHAKWTGVDVINSKYGNDAWVYRIPKDTVLTPNSSWLLQHKNLVHKKTGIVYDDFKTFYDKDVDAPPLTVIPKALTVIIGVVASA